LNSLADNIVGFAQILRQLGVRVSIAETIDAVESLTMIDNFDRDEFRSALKSTLVKTAEDQVAFEQAFDLFFVPPEAKQEQRNAWDSKQQLELEQTQQAEEELVFQGRPLDIPDDLKDVYKHLPEQDKKRLQEFLEKTSTGPACGGKPAEKFFIVLAASVVTGRLGPACCRPATIIRT